MKLRYTILYVDDVPATLDFFERAFGLERLFLHEGHDYGELDTGATKLAFASNALQRQLGKNTAAPDRNAPTFEIAFEVDDVEAAFNRAIQAGATTAQSVRQEPWGQTTSYVFDPNGFLIEICSKVTPQDGA